MFSGEVPTGTGVYPDEAQAYFKLPSPTNTASSGQSIICTSWASGSASSSATSASLDSCSYFSPAQSTSPPVADYRILQLSASQARPPHVPHKYVALSTQYVYAGVQRMSMLAHQVVDFRPIITGLQPEHLYSSLVPDISVVREQVSAIIRGKVIVGHSLWVDLSASRSTLYAHT
ncbi:hypothetical protein EW145_g1702 [Phellinidium pouzarii]|uniref:Exonuclease domain-containing protein n=1 Tax=Phellinidium pouzarii TaxID=167371 RepID=A0A4S4LDF8_9AGAM|nr:hypothetical protein EW145_g1702 [Phellinidium pouzarii]